MASPYIEQPVLDVPQFAGLMNDTWDVQPLPFRFSKAVNMYLHNNALHTIQPIRPAYMPELHDVGPVTCVRDYKNNVYRTHLIAVDQAHAPVGPFFGIGRANFTNGDTDVIFVPSAPPFDNENWNQWVVPGCKIRSRSSAGWVVSDWHTVAAVTGFHTGAGNVPHITLTSNFTGATDANAYYEITYPVRYTYPWYSGLQDFGFTGATKMFECQGGLVLVGKDIPVCVHHAEPGYWYKDGVIVGSGQNSPVDNFRVLQYNDGTVYGAHDNPYAMFRAPQALGAFALRHAHTGCTMNGLLLLGNTCEVFHSRRGTSWAGVSLQAAIGSPVIQFVGGGGVNLVGSGYRPGDLFFPPLQSGALGGAPQGVNWNKERYRIKTVDGSNQITLDRNWTEDYNAGVTTTDWALQKVWGNNFVRCCSLHNLHEWNGSGDGLGTYLPLDETPGEIVAMEGFGDNALVFKRDAIHSVYKTNSVDLINGRPLYTDIGSHGGYNAVVRLPNACMFMHNLDFYIMSVDGGGAKKVDSGYRTYLEGLLYDAAVMPVEPFVRAFGAYMPRQECVLWFLQSFAHGAVYPLTSVGLIYSLQSNQWTMFDFSPTVDWMWTACGTTERFASRRIENVLSGGVTTAPPTLECSYITGYDYRVYGVLAGPPYLPGAYLESCIFDFGLQGKITEPIWAHFKWSGYDSTAVAKPTFFLERSVEVDGSDLAKDVVVGALTDINDTQQKGKGRAFRLRMDFPNEYDVLHGIRFRVTDIVEK